MAEDQQSLSGKDMSEANSDSDPETYFSEEDEIRCGFAEDGDSTSDSDKDVPDTKKFPEGNSSELKKILKEPRTTESANLKILPAGLEGFLIDRYPKVMESLKTQCNDGQTLMYLTPSLLFDLQPSTDQRPLATVIGDVCVFNTKSPVKIFTLDSTDEMRRSVVRYNSKAARAFRNVDIDSRRQTKLENGRREQLDTEVGHDILQDINVISAVIGQSEWESPDKFLKKVTELERLAWIVELEDSLVMNPQRYDEIVRSFAFRLMSTKTALGTAPKALLRLTDEGEEGIKLKRSQYERHNHLSVTGVF